MMFYYQVQDEVLVSREALAGIREITEEEASKAQRLIFLSRRAGAGKAAWLVSHKAYLAEAEEGLWCLDGNQQDVLAQKVQDVPQWLEEKIAAGGVMGVCADLAQAQELLARKENADKKVVHILAMGDVGSTVLMALALLGGDCVRELGIYDFNERLCQRWEHEINQIAYPWAYDRLPAVRVLTEDELFQCDVFVFCASKSIPAIGADVQDVRMAQYEANSAIISRYGVLAREAGFQGLFAVVSDPVDQLCCSVWRASNRDALGNWDGKGLRPEQVQGYGLGVMNSRAAYYAKQDARFQSFLTEGRAYGPHGQQLVIANSVTHYDHALSMELTRLTVEANLEIRALGYKPYIAPAVSSAAISLLLTLRGEWHYSSNFLHGIYMGAKNRSTRNGLELEALPLPPQLLARLEAVAAELEKY